MAGNTVVAIRIIESRTRVATITLESALDGFGDQPHGAPGISTIAGAQAISPEKGP